MDPRTPLLGFMDAVGRSAAAVKFFPCNHEEEATMSDTGTANFAFFDALPAAVIGSIGSPWVEEGAYKVGMRSGLASCTRNPPIGHRCIPQGFQGAL